MAKTVLLFLVLTEGVFCITTGQFPKHKAIFRNDISRNQIFFPAKKILSLNKTNIFESKLLPRGDCFERDVNYQGEDINDGLMLLTASASECQDNCRVNADCNDFTWADPDSFPDSKYHNSCWMKKSVTLKSVQVGAVSGPKICDDPSGCCNTLTFRSTGSLAEGGQSHLLGRYDYVDEGPDGTQVYHQPGHGSSDPEVWLYFIGGFYDQWFISDVEGDTGGYAMISDDDQCPEDLDHRWRWYDWTSGGLVLDATAEMVCGDDPDPDPTDPPPSTCCNTLTFKSTGSLAEGGQSHLLGQYDYVDEGEEGTKIYHQPGHGGGNPEVWLYYLDGGYEQWFISDDVGYNGGFAWISDDKQCPESLDHRWKWYHWQTDSMILDPTAEMICGDDPDPDPTDPPPSNCCTELIFESTGGISDSIQKHVLGSYDYHSEGQDGTDVYKHTDRGDYLYYLTGLGVWYIGDTPGENLGYALNDDERKCPEQLAKEWKWTDGEDWILDDVANMRCR